MNEIGTGQYLSGVTYFVALMAAIRGVRPEFWPSLRQPAFTLDLAASLATGALAAVASRLAAAKINIKCAYASPGGGGRAQIVLAVANPDKAERALG